MNLALEGIRILESAHQYPGPYCSMLLADLGAEVLKVERPGMGDLARQSSDFFRSINRNKKSLTLDLKAPFAKEVLHRLVERSDVFMEGFRPGVASRLGIDYVTLREINPRLVYCSISGYGQDGPYRDLPGHDLNYQAMAGMLECFKDKEENLVEPGLAIGDLSSGMFAAIGILAALMSREKTGQGQYVDISMFDGLLSLMSTLFGIFSGTGRFGGIVEDAGYGIFKAGDGLAFTLGIAHEDWFWDRICAVVGLPECQGIQAPGRRMRRKELAEKLQNIFITKPQEEWLKILKAADVPVSPVQKLNEVEKDCHVLFRQMIQEITLSTGEQLMQTGIPIKLSETPGRILLPPPGLGEHTVKILESLAFTQDEIVKLENEHVI